MSPRGGNDLMARVGVRPDIVTRRAGAVRMKRVSVLAAITMLGLFALPTFGRTQEPAYCMQKFAPLKEGCDSDFAKCKQYVENTGKKTSCNEQYAFCQSHWKQIINRGDSQCFKQFKGPPIGRDVLKPG